MCPLLGHTLHLQLCLLQMNADELIAMHESEGEGSLGKLVDDAEFLLSNARNAAQLQQTAAEKSLANAKVAEAADPDAGAPA